MKWKTGSHVDLPVTMVRFCQRTSLKQGLQIFYLRLRQDANI